MARYLVVCLRNSIRGLLTVDFPLELLVRDRVVDQVQSFAEAEPVDDLVRAVARRHVGAAVYLATERRQEARPVLVALNKPVAERQLGGLVGALALAVRLWVPRGGDG